VKQQPCTTIKRQEDAIASYILYTNNISVIIILCTDYTEPVEKIARRKLKKWKK